MSDTHGEAQSIEADVEEAKRCFALKEWSQAADAYGQVLESLRGTHDEEDPIFAPLLHRYGHALLEHAIATSGALGGGGGTADKDTAARESKTVASARAMEPTTEKEAERAIGQASSSKTTAQDPRFTFGGDAEESEEEEEGPAANANGEGAGDDDDDDDLGLAFSILELARVRYEKVMAGDGSATLETIDGEKWSTVMIKSQLAEVLNDLADVGLESENFQQASTDYKTALEMLTPLLQAHSRRLADAYLRLGLALEFHPDAALQATAEKYVRGASTTLQKRLESLDARQRVLLKERDTGETGLATAEAAASEIRSEKAEMESEKRLREEGVVRNSQGKEAEVHCETTYEKDDVLAMDLEQVEKEQRDVGEMIQELQLKLEEYASAASAGGSAHSASTSGPSKETAKDTLQKAINEALLGASTNTLDTPRLSNPDAPVNDLSAMVKKKKKVENGKESGKRKESDNDAIQPPPSESDKRAKLG